MKEFLGLFLGATVTFSAATAYVEPVADAYTVSELDADAFDREAAETLYIDKLFGTDTPTPYADHGSELLTGAAKEVYEQVKVYLKEIADGERTRTDNLLISASIAITVDDIIAARDFLYADCPEYLYWNNGRIGYYGGGTTNTLTFYVTSEYSVSGEDNGVSINPSKMNKARKAVENAKSIASKYDGKSAHEKIYGYANEICALTDYDYSYTNHDLVNVFDGDESTKVVCEGYAKAFQYLCDLGGIDCYNVTGSNHRWNIVVLDGKSYHVDCTWADAYDIETIASYHPYILRGVAESDGKGVKFNFTIPGYMRSEGSLTYDEEMLSLYPQNILRVSTEDYELPKSGTIKVNIKTLDSGAPDTSGLNVIVSGSGENKSVELANGLFDVSELADGAYTFTFSAKNCVPGAYDVRIENGKAKGLSSVELNLLGDVDGSGSIKMQDVILAFRATRNSGELTLYQIAVADANKDGSAKMSDVRAIYNHTRGESLWG